MSAPASTAPPALRVRGVTRRFGGLEAVKDVDLDVPAGQRRLVLGPNGAGKSVLFNCIGGQLPVSDGHIELHGRDITQDPPRRRAQRGIARTFQFSSVFPSMTVAENVVMAHHARERLGRRALTVMPVGEREPARVREMLERWGLDHARDEPVGALSYGQQRKVDLVMALVHDPRVLLLDEPAAGLAAAEREAIAEMVRSLSREVTVLLVEHDVEIAFEMADEVTVLHMGHVIAEGKPHEISRRPEVQAAYFGEV